jgi:transcriptional regulator
VEQRDDLLQILRQSVNAYEGARPNPWGFDPMSADLEKLLKSIVGFRVEITHLEGKWKLSQNHSEQRRRRVVRALLGQPDADSQAIAGLMQDDLNRTEGRRTGQGD